MQIWAGTYFGHYGGASEVKHIGIHPKPFHIKSMKIPNGQKVRFGDQHGNKTGWWYRGEYSEFDFFVDGHFDAVTASIEVATHDYDGEFVEVGWRRSWSNGHYDAWKPFPIGKHDAAKNFPNDELDFIRVPENMNATVYVDGGEQGNNITLGQGQHDLGSLGFGNTVSSVDIEADDFTAIGNPELHFDKMQRKDGETLAVSRELVNDSDGALTSRVEVNQTASTEHSQTWKVSSSITASAEVGGTVGVAEVKVGLSATVGAEYGQDSKDGKTTSITIEDVVEVPPRSKAVYTGLTKTGKAVIPMSQQVRNTRTGKTYTIEGEVRADFAFDSKGSVKGGRIMA